MLVSHIGTMAHSVGAAWLMTEMTHSPRMVALVQTSSSVPVLLLALFAGAVADNFERRRLLIAFQCAMMLVSALLGVLAWQGLLTPYGLLGLTFVLGCAAAMHIPAWQASIGDIVPREVLPAAVAYNSISFNIARSTGPAIGGVIVALAGSSAAFLANAASFIGTIMVMLRWKPARAVSALPREQIGSAMAGGLRYAAMSPPLLRILLRLLLFTANAAAVTAMLPIVARDMIHGGAGTYGVLLGAFGVGAVCGATSSPRLRRIVTIRWLLTIAALSLAIGTALLSQSTSLWTALPALMLTGGGWVVGVSNLSVSMQLAAPRWMAGRAIALFETVIFGSIALGSWLYGVATSDMGLAQALALSAVLQFVTLAVALLIRLPEIGSFDLTLQQQWNEPETALPVDPRSGPIAIAITYRIKPDDVPEFLSEMRHWQRMRRRDGARGWTLYRDLADPGLWVERYQVPTWLDYVRHNRRRTLEDASHGSRIRALHQGKDAPAVQRLAATEPVDGDASPTTTDGIGSGPL